MAASLLSGAVLALTITFIVAVAGNDNINCSASAPADSMNYFNPPLVCDTEIPAVGWCRQMNTDCANQVKNDCAAHQVCIQAFLSCVSYPADVATSQAATNINASSPCQAWNESLSNAKLYLDMGGVYNGSALQTACNYGACQRRSQDCVLNTPLPSSICAAEPRAPSRFTVQFGGPWIGFLLRSRFNDIYEAVRQDIAFVLHGAQDDQVTWEKHLIRVRKLEIKPTKLLTVEVDILDSRLDRTSLVTKFSNGKASAANIANLVKILPGASWHGFTDLDDTPSPTEAPPVKCASLSRLQRGMDSPPAACLRENGYLRQCHTTFNYSFTQPTGWCISWTGVTETVYRSVCYDLVARQRGAFPPSGSCAAWWQSYDCTEAYCSSFVGNNCEHKATPTADCKRATLTPLRSVRISGNWQHTLARVNDKDASKDFEDKLIEALQEFLGKMTGFTTVNTRYHTVTRLELSDCHAGLGASMIVTFGYTEPRAVVQRYATNWTIEKIESRWVSPAGKLENLTGISNISVLDLYDGQEVVVSRDGHKQRPAACNVPRACTTSSNHYRPPQACFDAERGIGRCANKRRDCTANATGCVEHSKCLRQFVFCLNNLPPAATNGTECAQWQADLEDALALLRSGGVYTESALQKSCEELACSEGLNGNCQFDATRVCRIPRRPPRFNLRLGGNVWAGLLANPNKKAKLLTLVTRGLARLLKVNEHIIQVLSMSSGSLVVEFYLLDDEADGNAVSETLAVAATDTSLLASAFAELESEAGISIEVTELSTSGNTSVTPSPLFQPSPDTPPPESTDSASFASVMVALTAMMVALL